MIKAIQAKPITGMSSPADIRSQNISAWFYLLTEDYKKSLAELNDDQGELTPLKAWHYAFGEFSSANCQCSACLLSQPARKTRLRSAPAQKSQSESIAAPVEAVQEQDTPTLEQFQRWLEDKAHAAHAEYFNGPKGETLAQEIERCRPITALLSRTRTATELLMLFKLEQGA